MAKNYESIIDPEIKDIYLHTPISVYLPFISRKMMDYLISKANTIDYTSEEK